MSLISNGIDSVRVFALPAGIWPNGEHVNLPQTALVQWRSLLSDVLYQVYVNGNYAGSTVHCSQRQMLISVPTSFSSPIRIEVFGVLPEYADMDFSSEFPNQTESNRIKILLSRSQTLPTGSTFQIYYDNGTCEIDYENPLTPTPIQVWENWQDKSGFGMSIFGLSDFGYDSSGAVGFAKGSFGKNQFGIDSDIIEWISPVLSDGTYKFAVKVFDKAGDEIQRIETEAVTLISSVKPLQTLEILSYDKQTKNLTFKIT